MQSDTIIVNRIIRDTIYPAPITLVKTEYITDTIRTMIFKGIKIPADTLAIIQEYLTVKSYSDVLKDDKTAFILLNEKLYANRIIERELIFESRCRDKIVVNTLDPKGVYILGSVGASMEAPVISAEVIYLKNQKIKGIEIGYNETPYVQLVFGFKF